MSSSIGSAAISLRDARSSDSVALQSLDGAAPDSGAALIQARRNFFARTVAYTRCRTYVAESDGQIVGVGAGQMSRVDSCKIGAMKAVLPLAGTVAASDAFFPLPDGVEEIARAGATAIIQPGGSVRDLEVVETANRLNLAMVLTGVRHFRH